MFYQLCFILKKLDGIENFKIQIYFNLYKHYFIKARCYWINFKLWIRFHKIPRFDYFFLINSYVLGCTENLEWNEGKGME